MTKERSAKIVNFIPTGQRSFLLGRGYISYYSEYALSSTLSIYITLIAIVLSVNNAAFIFIYLMTGLLIVSGYSGDGYQTSVGHVNFAWILDHRLVSANGINFGGDGWLHV